jgi:hypothetical protein
MLTDSTLSRAGLDSPVDDLVARVERIVRCRTGGRIRDLRVEVQGGDVIISGIACTYYAKQLATHAALGELDQRTLSNAIEVM